MKLDRNITKPRRGKYALIKLRIDGAILEPMFRDARIIPTHYEVKKQAVDFGNDDDSDFFVIRLKDKYAAAALGAYGAAAFADDPEYGLSVLNLAKAAAEHPAKRIPD